MKSQAFRGLLLASALLVFTGLGASDSVEIDYVYMDGCPYCAEQESFHEELKQDYPENLTINKYDITSPLFSENLQDLEDKHNVSVERQAAPMTFVEGEHFTGFNPEIEAGIREAVSGELGEPVEREEDSSHYIPLIGELDPEGIPLIALAALLGFIDGLNVCSIGALLLVLGIVVKFDSRRKILGYGGLFIFTTVAVYGGLIFVWYGVVEALMQYIGTLSLLIGLAGLLGGLYFFRQFVDFYRNGPTCKTTNNKYVNKFSTKVSERLQDDSTGLYSAAVAVVLFAAAITLVELPCSVALPLTFTGILAEAQLSGLTYSLYILVYLLMYMMIELAIFLVAVFTKDLWYGPDKAVTWTTLLASLILVGLGLYYLPFTPVGM